jgi:branched-chain amino acid transport system ATP-binding protein
MAPLLTLDEVSTFYGDAQILAGVSLTIEAGETVCLLGRNGRGKTTTIKSILGLAPVRSGRITLDGVDITRWPTHLIARRGVAWVPDNRRVFPTLTVERNLAMALNRATAATGAARWTLARVYQRFPILDRLKARSGEHLSGGEAQLVAIARALLMHPRLVLLDEPSQGLAPRIVEQIFETIDRIRRERRLTILLVEQRVVEALELCDRGYVLETGRVALEGTHTALLADPRVQRAYLGA